MIILDDLAMLVLEGIRDYANKAHLTSLEDYLRGIRLLYERKEISEEEFRRLEAQVTENIKELRDSISHPSRRSIDIGF